MKIKSLEIKNIGMVEDQKIEINKNLNLFYGQTKQGKSTIAIKSIQMLLGTGFPDDVIRHGEKEGSITMVLENGSISRSYYYNKAGKITARELVYIKDGQPVPKPARAIANMINPFLLDQDILAKKTGFEREKFFFEIFDIDTDKIDNEIAVELSAAKDLRAEVKAIGEINVEPVELIDVEDVKGELDGITMKYNQEKSEWQAKCNQIRAKVSEEREAAHDLSLNIDQANMRIRNHKADIESYEAKILELQKSIQESKGFISDSQKWLEENPPIELEPTPLPEEPQAPDTSELDEKISDAKANKVLYDQYQENLKKQEAKNAKAKTLKEKEMKIAELRKEKTTLLASFSEETGIDGISFNEDGKLTYENTSFDMISTSQQMELSQKMAATMSNDLGIELIDRGESLGDSIYKYIDRAKNENIAIMAAIVGEAPAEKPEDADVWVVEDGSAEKQE